MTNREVNEIKEFRRFATTYIYPCTINILIGNISNSFDSNGIMFSSSPQQIIKLAINESPLNINKQEYIEKIHTILKDVFVKYFNDPYVSSIVKNRIHVNIQDGDMKKILMSAMLEIQLGNPRYISLLFNITLLNNVFYIYL